MCPIVVLEVLSLARLSLEVPGSEGYQRPQAVRLEV